MTNVVSVEDLTVRYGTEAPIFEQVTFAISKGEVVSLIGRSGTGKTSVLNCIANFIPYEGQVTRTGRLSYVFQRNALFPFMTVADNITFGLDDLNQTQRQTVVEQTLDIIGLPNFGDRYPRQLSGGQAQRVALGQAIAVKPDLILLDEAFAALDLLTRDQMTDWFKSLVTNLGLSVLMTSHYLDEVIALSQQVVILSSKRTEVVKFITAPERYSTEFQTLKQQLTSLL